MSTVAMDCSEIDVRLQENGARVGLLFAAAEVRDLKGSFPGPNTGRRVEPLIGMRVESITERRGGGFVVLCELCSAGGSLRQGAAMSLGFSCTDGCSASREAHYVGDPTRGTSCPLWETAVPWWGPAESGSQDARGVESAAARQTWWGSDGAVHVWHDEGSGGRSAP